MRNDWPTARRSASPSSEHRALLVEGSARFPATAMNPTFLISATPSAWPDSVTVNWRRLSHGLWRVPEGDIHAAYSAESFPRIAVFSHEGRLFTNCGVHFCGAVHAKADCYALIPGGEYREPEQRQYTYEGREAAYRGEVFRLGPKVVFKTSDPTVEEWRRLLRVHYADGGMFSARCTYLEFLDQRFAPNSENEESARQKELAECCLREMPRNQAEMRRLLETGGDPAHATTQPKQTDLAL